MTRRRSAAGPALLGAPAHSAARCSCLSGSLALDNGCSGWRGKEVEGADEGVAIVQPTLPNSPRKSLAVLSSLHLAAISNNANRRLSALQPVLLLTGWGAGWRFDSCVRKEAGYLVERGDRFLIQILFSGHRCDGSHL